MDSEITGKEKDHHKTDEYKEGYFPPTLPRKNWY
jgi:hypothetical protein